MGSSDSGGAEVWKLGILPDCHVLTLTCNGVNEDFALKMLELIDFIEVMSPCIVLSQEVVAAPLYRTRNVLQGLQIRTAWDHDALLV